MRHSGSHSGKTWACRKDCTAIQAVAVAEARGSDERRNPRFGSFSALRSVAGCKSVRLHRREAVVEYRHSEVIPSLYGLSTSGSGNQRCARANCRKRRGWSCAESQRAWVRSDWCRLQCRAGGVLNVPLKRASPSFRRARGSSIGRASRTSQGTRFRMSFDISALWPGC